MKELEYLINTLGEECCEVAVRCSKVNRFGLAEVQEGQSQSNGERLSQELDDLHAVLEELEARGLYTYTPNAERIAQKRSKIEKYMNYSARIGCLDEGNRDADSQDPRLAALAKASMVQPAGDLP